MITLVLMITAQTCDARAPTRGVHERARAIAIDLTGHLPSDTDRQALDSAAPGSEEQALASLVDKWLQAPEFAARVARRHRAILWNETSDVTLLYPPYTGIYPHDYGPGVVWYRPYAWMARYRLADSTFCDPNTPATFDSDGNVIPIQTLPTRIEGYVMVEPYWAPGTQIKVCAYDAQTRLVSASGETCGPWSESAGCGCGPNLRWCATAAAVSDVGRSFGDAVTAEVQALIEDDRPYEDLFTEPAIYVNGPMAHFLRYWWDAIFSQKSGVQPVPKERIPVIPYTDTTFHRVEVPHASGVLTSFAYLLRFPTNRARASRFSAEVLCRPFQPPASGIDLSGSALEADLQVRGGCKYCHAQLEPMASYFGRWAENGVGWLEPTRFPKEREDCVICGRSGASYCNADCRDHYFVHARLSAEYDFVGRLHSYIFRRPEHETHIDAGPRGMVLASLSEDDAFARCTVRQSLRWLASNEDGVLIERLTQEFQTGRRFSDLVRSIVLDDAYGRQP